MNASYLNDWNADLLDEYYQRWKQDPASVDSSWSAFFEGFELGSSGGHNGEAGIRPKNEVDRVESDRFQDRVDGLIYNYRMVGHTQAQIDPLGQSRPESPALTLSSLGLNEVPLNTVVSSRYFQRSRRMSLGSLIDTLRAIYCGPIGVEFMHIQNETVRDWVRERMEERIRLPQPDSTAQKRLLRCLMEAETFEQFVHTKFIGQKRFSLQGAESLMVVLETILAGCPGFGVSEIVMGMAHRGRLTVLANFLRKSYDVIFKEFSENYIPDLVAGDGDVKYHLGYESVRKLESGAEVEIRLAANPSHLEIVDPVVEGKARARQRILEDTEKREKVLPLLIHGDAAFAGQGVVAEVLNLSKLPGYRTGGTLHVIVNNQIGFTTLPADARSTMYCTDVAKMIEAPIFHVNGDDPIAVEFVAKLALEFRQKFSADIVVDMYCYRRYGHNETDEPSFTQPRLYKKIHAHPAVTKLFKDRMLESGVLTEQESQTLEGEFKGQLEIALGHVRTSEVTSKKEFERGFEESTAVFQPPYSHSEPDTKVSKELVDLVVNRITRVPDGLVLQPQVKKLFLDRRRNQHQGGGPYDWSFAEALAFGTLLVEGTPVRLSGQDSRRGTFSQRHCVLYDTTTGKRYTPLANLKEGQARFCVYNSMLSEAAVLGFDYGYSLDFPDMLCLWEAQFGDFANGAQVIIDQFIASSESKWQRPSGIVLLLPHGYEGQGPEHSSARLERFLQLCAEDNIQVCNLTTPAQYFHVLRRQVRRDFRKPLIIMTPKSLLRNERATSWLEDFTESSFQPVIGPTQNGDAKEIDRIIFCSGKVYYDLAAYVESNRIRNAALVRVEQLYPLDLEGLANMLGDVAHAKTWVWCQEEPRNMGAWSYIEPLLARVAGHEIEYSGRPAAASPAVGSKAWHDQQQKELVHLAFTV
ncbi:MAG TPA: 2-oxoglutarate dehydrogenase E1 component [Chthoniobacterales bacterium]|nr:2-oxoglutarate dehydrogenase E1 component [Chthoniobacterales bacterium]